MLLALCAFLSSAFAADSTFTGTDKSGAIEKPEAHLTAQLGGQLTTGNTETWSLSAGLDGSYRWDKNKIALVAGANFGQSIADVNGDGRLDDDEREAGKTEQARKLFGDARYDRYFSAKDSLYVLAGVLTDPFAGFDNRAHAQLGYSRILVGPDKPVTIVTELGFDVAREDYVEGVDPNDAIILAARALVGFNYKISESASFNDTIEVYENVQTPEDVRILNKATLSTKISSMFSLNLSHSLTFDNVPVTDFRKTDQTLTATIVASVI